MNDKGRLVRLLASAAAALVSCLFVSRYNWASYLSLERGQSLPAVTRYLVHATPYAYAIPGLVVLLGVVLVRRGSGSIVAFECLVAIAWLIALGWALAAVFAWQVVHIVLYSGPHS